MPAFSFKVGRRMADSRTIHPRTWRGTNCKSQVYLIYYYFLYNYYFNLQVPCTHALLAKWIPPQERSRMGAVVYAGAQFGTVISMPISGLLAEHSWPSIFYVFGFLGVVWSLAFLWTVYEDPQSSPKISTTEKNFINKSLWGNGTADKSPAIPWKFIATSMPFYAILFAHVRQSTKTLETFSIIYNL